MNLTADSLALFDALAWDAPNWGGTPLVEVTKEERGNLTQLKRAGLITTVVSDGNLFAGFTDKGRELAAARGFPLA